MNFAPHRARSKRGPVRTAMKVANCVRSIAFAKTAHHDPAAIANAARARDLAHPAAAREAIPRTVISVDRVPGDAMRAAVRDVPIIAIVVPDNPVRPDRTADLDRIRIEGLVKIRTVDPDKIRIAVLVKIRIVGKDNVAIKADSVAIQINNRAASISNVLTRASPHGSPRKPRTVRNVAARIRIADGALRSPAVISHAVLPDKVRVKGNIVACPTKTIRVTTSATA